MSSTNSDVMDAAIVTGVSRGLGAALARNLLERGYSVLGIGRSSDGSLNSGSYEFAEFDFAQVAEMDGVLGGVLERLRAQPLRSATLINNAASLDGLGQIGRLTARELAAAIAVNLAAPLALTNLFCRVFAGAAFPCRVINLSSGAAQRPIPGEAAYCAAKAGLEIATATVAAESQAPGFRAISVRPGVIDTEMQVHARSQPPEVLPSVDVFKQMYEDGMLLPPATVAAEIVDQLITGEVDHGSVYGPAPTWPKTIKYEPK